MREHLRDIRYLGPEIEVLFSDMEDRDYQNLVSTLIAAVRAFHRTSVDNERFETLASVMKNMGDILERMNNHKGTENEWTAECVELSKTMEEINNLVLSTLKNSKSSTLKVLMYSYNRSIENAVTTFKMCCLTRPYDFKISGYGQFNWTIPVRNFIYYIPPLMGVLKSLVK
eukprot:TRINITY_DN1101_c0_g1_i3.p1 TRINITY_DN1101_c0_g1~~TRINITY_DN1101_c0_g1_i3.p1  ORF type:complete len:171 (-),score=31.94 TRINITY_DN1101_c0_g1_i3:17-529(-)